MKHLVRVALGLMGLMGTLAIGVVNAETTIKHNTGSSIEYRLNDNTEHFTGVGTITITDGTDTITILDRNLGATAVGTGCDYKTNGNKYCPYDETYGYHFQRGNNYGFTPGCDLSGQFMNSCSDEITSGAVNGQVDVTTISYDPNNQEYYESGVFYKGNENWLNDNSKVDLWGGSTGGTDTITSTSSLNGDNWKVDESTVKNRQGPCPEGFHVPSIGELIKLFSMVSGSNYSEKAAQLHDNLYIPFAGYRLATTASVFNMGTYAYLWSSSPNSWVARPDSYDFNLSVYNGWDEDIDNRADAFAIRCFYNKYEFYPQIFTLRFLDDGVEIVSGSVVSGEIRTGTIPTLDEKEGYEFDYRYADGTDTEFDFTSPITGDVKLHAHRTITAKIPNGIYTGLDNGDITVIWNDDIWGSINLTLAGSELEGYYKRGFNYDTNRSIWSGSDGLGTYIGEDGKMYGNTYGVNDARGGSGDNYENGFDDGNERYKRQGPCPVGYHIPSRGERNALTIARCNLDTLCNKIFTMQHASGWTDSNKLIFINGGMLGNRIRSSFNLTTPGLSYWSSSPNFDSVNKSWTFYFDPDHIHPDSNNDRAGNYFIRTRCFKNYITVPQTFTITFLNGNEHVWSGDIVSGDKIPEEVISGYNLTGLTKEGYTFSGWIISGSDEMFDVENDIITTGMILNAVWQINQYTITFKDGDNEITSITADYGTGITPPDNPIKNGYRFVGWEPEVPATMPAENITINAKWDKTGGGSSGGGGGGGGGGGSSSSCKNLPANAVANNSSTPSSNTNYYYSTNTSKVCTFQCKTGYTRNAEKETCDKVSDTQTTSGTTVKEPEGTGNNTKVETGNNTEIQTGSKIDTPEQASQDNKQDTQDSTTKTPEGKTNSTTSSTYSPEFQEAYEFAHENGITTKNTIESADMNGKLTRIAMAKMLSQYAINVLGKTPDTTQNNKFDDVSDKRDADYDNGVTLAYQLGIMGQNMPGNKFRPNDEVSRAEFATALSRMLYNTSDGQYKSTDKYYTNHMSKLVKEGIITKDDPKMKELRGYVMIMLMRSAK